jgi:signal transduction histidine kinase
MTTTELSTKFVQELQNRKLKILKILYNFLLTLTLAVEFLYIYTFIFERDKISNLMFELFFLIITLINILFLYIRFKLIYKRLEFSLNLIALAFSFATLITIAISGNDIVVPFALSMISMISISIILGIKKSLIFTLILSLIYGLVAVLQITGVIEYVPKSDETRLFNSIFIISLFWLIYHISRVGYFEIQNSYQSALNYAKQLEELNRDLDAKVIDRTKKLEESYETQIESMYNSAVVGNITKSLLHDIANPLSSIRGALELMTTSQNKDQELITITESSIEQIIRIIDDAKDLMRGKSINSEFSPDDKIKEVIRIFTSELDKNRVKVKFNSTNKKLIYGIDSVFQRIIINLVWNSIEELKNIEGERIININIDVEENFVIVKIKDNGRGISKEFINEVFDTGFSTKNSDHNMGLGLAFVKKMIIEKFQGKVEVSSKKNLYTEFKLYFGTDRNAEKNNKVFE